MGRTVLLMAFILVLSPGKPLIAGGWTQEQSELWFKFAFFLLDTDKRFASSRFQCGDHQCTNGEIYPYFFNGRVQSYSPFLEARYGLTDNLELELMVPYYHIQFTDAGNPDREPTSSVGDIRFGARYNFLEKPFVYTLEIQGKAPTGFFNKDAEIVPVGDGQWDLKINNQFSKSLWPWPAYINLELGYKYRFRPPLRKTNFAPGNEWTFWLEAGYNVTKKLLVKSSLNGFIGGEGEAILSGNNIFIRPESDRRIMYLEPGLFFKASDHLFLETSVKIPLLGKNFPAGNVYGIGIAYNGKISWK